MGSSGTWPWQPLGLPAGARRSQLGQYKDPKLYKHKFGMLWKIVKILHIGAVCKPMFTLSLKMGKAKSSIRILRFMGD